MVSRKPTPVRLALVEDHDATRAALADSLMEHRERVDLVATFRDAESFLASRAVPQIDVTLMDIGLPGMSGIDATRQLVDRSPRVRVLALTAFDDEANLFAALASGAYGYLLKDEPTGRVVSAIEEAAAGEHPISSRVAGFLITRARRGPPPVALSDREEQLATMLAEGLTYAECSARMQVSLSTVQEYVKRLYRKLDVNSRKQVREWVELHRRP
ncbi:MAG TPA: response regulator transcription factor [Labilithrix sp.]|nr:response regulator transcription factor [Labilithrix sp.]